MTAARLLTVSEAAERLGVGERFVRRLIAERRIETVRLGRHVRFDPQAIDLFIAASTTPALHPPVPAVPAALRMAR